MRYCDFDKNDKQLIIDIILSYDWVESFHVSTVIPQFSIPRINNDKTDKISQFNVIGYMNDELTKTNVIVRLDEYLKVKRNIKINDLLND